MFILHFNVIFSKFLIYVPLIFIEFQQSCSKPHPSHVYLNYYQVEAPKQRMIEMMNTLIDIESRDMVRDD